MNVLSFIKLNGNEDAEEEEEGKKLFFKHSHFTYKE